MSVESFTENVCMSAEDLTGGNPVVVLAPHPDDETLGCGGLLADAFARAGAHVVCMTDGSASHPGSSDWPPDRLARQRHRELLEALRRLGGGERDLTWLGYPDGLLSASDPHPIAERILRICRQTGAERLFSPSPVDHHPDHKATADIARRVSGLCPSLRLFYYPIWSRWDEPDFHASHRDKRGVRVDMTNHRRRKVRALKAHRSQLGHIVGDAPDGFCLEPEMVRVFSEGDEFYFEVPRCP